MLTDDQKRRFMAAVRSAPMMFGEIASASGLPMTVVLDCWAAGSDAGKLILKDDMPGFRHIAEVTA